MSHEPRSSADLMIARDGFQKLVPHFGTGAATKKTGKKPRQRAKTSVPIVVRMRPKATHEVDHFISALQGVLFDRDSLMAAWSKFCAVRDRDTYRGRKRRPRVVSFATSWHGDGR